MSHNYDSDAPPQRYRAYMLRLWQESPGQPWRASLQDASTQQRHGFPDLDQLLTFLHAQTGQGCGAIERVETQDNNNAQSDDY